ncbi:MAG: hypothetical protein ACLQGV_06625 [Bryobacteraceae bacterium]
MRFVFLFLLAAATAFPQKLSFGLIGGRPFEDVIDSGITLGSVISPSSAGYTIGPKLELHVPHRLSVEADVLYRPASANLAGTSPISKITASEWRIPLLLKYRFTDRVVTPFVSAGPALRAFTGAQDGSGGSTAGVAAAVGLEGKATLIRLTGELRYTRWGSATLGSLVTGLEQLNGNQVEVLASVTF